MRIGVFGTGVVGTTIASKLVSLGHDVKLGSRSARNEKAAEWAKKAGRGASHGTFADAASHGELVFNCTSGAGAVEAVRAAGPNSLRGKIIIDLTNPLDFSKGMPPSSLFKGDDSLGEQIQNAAPDSKVVKTLNTINVNVMIDPARVPGDHDLVICGDDAEAKKTVARYMREWFGWKSIVDTGGIISARAQEAYVLFWIGLMVALKTTDFNIRIVK